LETFREDLGKVDGNRIGAVLVEPIQGRGGIVVPPEGFLITLRDWCDEVGAVLILDEIYTGFWRTGKMFACEWENKVRVDSRGPVVVPDIICLGKALSGGFPISVCVGRAEVMDAWPESGGEALHTSTFLGNPMGCAMALEAIRRYQEPETESLVREASEKLEIGLRKLESLGVVKEVRGRGLMMGVEMDSGERVLDLTKALLRVGVIVLPDGPKGEVLALTPPLGISGEEIDFSMGLLRNLIEF
jgi:acetylornithine/succinyldiaminopimelate/putrescine aminotransferase